jgi:four helix bundle protein
LPSKKRGKLVTVWASLESPIFVKVALKEARETRYWLILILEAELLPAKRLSAILTEIEEIIKVLYTIIQNSKGQSS